MAVQITRHAYRRGKERLGLNRPALERIAMRAFTDGRRRQEFTGTMARYLDMLYFRHHTANNIRIHGEHVFLFGQDTLITIHPVPRDLRSRLR